MALDDLRIMRKILRIMRTSPHLLGVFGTTLQAILAATLLQPGRAWYLSDLAAYLKVSPSSLQRKLAALSQAGILDRRTDSNRVYYQANPSCPILSELTGIFTKTIGLVEPLQNALRPYQQEIDVAFIYGSIAEQQETSDSDIDLL